MQKSIKRKERFSRAIARSTRAVLEKLYNIPDKPESIKYFYDILKDTFVENRPAISAERYSGIKKIGIYCMMVPEELIYAAGAIPVRLCGGSFEASCAGDELLPRDTCPVVKASVGFTAFELNSLYDLCDLIIVPATCDAKRKMAEELAQYKEVVLLEVPHVKDSEKAKKEWLEHIYALKKYLEKYTGQKITRARLHSAAIMLDRARYQTRRLYELRKSSRPLICGRLALPVMNAYGIDMADNWTKAMEKLNNELEKKKQGSLDICENKIPRIFIAGCPSIFPNWKIPFIIEESGGIVVSEESCTGERFLYDPVAVTEKSLSHLMNSLAAKYIMPCICPSFSPNKDRLFRLQQIVEGFNVTGIIYYVLKGCLLYDFELKRVEDTLRDMDIPVLRVETDYNPEDVEQLRTRIEAFMEMLVSKKRNV